MDWPLIGIDTNVLVRLLVGDDPAQTAEATVLLLRAEQERARIFISDVALCETAWVLRRTYRFTPDQIADALAYVLHSDLTTFADSGLLERALHAFRTGACEFADYVLRERSLAVGAQTVATFDQRALTEPGFVRPDPDSWPADLDVREEAPPYRRRRRAAAPA